ncbi:MAG: ABC transporter substrate-binding protein [Vulcanimicrobiota bacterium]
MSNVKLLILCLLLLAAPALAQPQPATDDQDLVIEEVFESLGEAVDPGEQYQHVLTFWCSPYPLEQGWAVQVTRRWNHLHPDQAVRLVGIPPDRLAEDVLREAIKKGETPDLSNHLFPSNVAEFAPALRRLDDFPKLMSHLADRSGQGAAAPFRSPDGGLYQLPWKGNPILLQYNTAMFRRYGVEPPRTYSDLLKAARELQAREQVFMLAPDPADKFWRRYYDFYPLFLAASGGQSLLKADGSANFDNAAGVAVMTFLKELYASGAAPRQELYPDASDELVAFTSDKLATLLTGPWNIELTRDIGGEAEQFDFGPVPVPDDYPVDQPVYSYGNFRNFGIFKSCQNPELAAEFILFATSHESDLDLLRTTHELPFRQGLESDPQFVTALQLEPAHLSKFALQARWLKPVDNVPYFNEVLKALSKEVVACAVEGKKTPEQAIHDAALATNGLSSKR